MLLAVGLAAVIAGARSFTAIGERSGDSETDALAALGVTGARPAEPAVRHAGTREDVDLLDQVIGAWIWTRTGIVEGRRVIAVDGKTVRGARTASAAAPHLVAALEHGTGSVGGQLQIGAKSNVIPAVRELLDQFELAETLVTIDAMHAQRETAEHIVAAGGH